MDRDSKKLFHKVIVDLLCLGSVGFPVLMFYMFGSPYQRGFFCGDESIRYPFKESTVSSSILYTVGLGLPTLVVCLHLEPERPEHELMNNEQTNIQNRTHYEPFDQNIGSFGSIRMHSFVFGLEDVTQTFLVSVLQILFIEYSMQNNEQSRYSLLGTPIPNWMYSVYNNILWFLFGAACSQLTTDIGKYTIGRLRPHFLDICKPDVDCNNDMNKTKYNEDFTCGGERPNKFTDSRLSFPSGHSSLSFYCMVYLALYLQARVKTSKYGMARSLAQFVVILMATFCALSRVSDYKHHWSDVLAGTILGITTATITALYVSELFASKYKSLRKRNSSADDIETTNNLQTTELK